MRGDNSLLALTTTTDEVTGEVKPLFAFPIQVCKATEDTDIKLDVRAPSGSPRQQTWMDEGTGEIVSDEDCLRGIAVGDELKPIDPEAWKNIGATVKAKTATMVALGKIDLTPDFWTEFGSRVKGRYFVQSPTKGGSAKAYRITYEALLPTKKKGAVPARPARAIVTKRCPRTKQALCIIYADARLGCLMLLEFHFAAAIRQPDQAILAPLTAEVAEAQVDMARQVIDGMPDGIAALEAEVDEATVLRGEMIEKALDGEEITAPKPIAETKAEESLEALLAASLAAAK